MGTVISKAANGIGVLAGNAFVLPIKTIFGKSCKKSFRIAIAYLIGTFGGRRDIWVGHYQQESTLRLFSFVKKFDYKVKPFPKIENWTPMSTILVSCLLLIFTVNDCSNLCRGVCSGTWDLICFIEHLCISSLVRLLMVAILTYITLLFFYLLFQVGIVQCIGRSLCKMTWAACETYWTALEEIGCFLWHKLRNTKRVYRHRYEDMEEAFSTSDDYNCSEESVRVIRRRRSIRDRRKDRIRRSLYPTSYSSKRRRYQSGSRHHVRMRTREVSVRVKGIQVEADQNTLQ